MPCILNIETSTTVCSVALSVDGNLVFNKVSAEGPSHAVLLGVFVSEVIDFLNAESLKLDAVAVSSGPGSYTGLRIGVSMAKGLCFGYGIPLISIPTLKIMAYKAVAESNSDSERLYCSMLDARRMEVYAAIYDSKLQVVRDTAADIVTSETYESYLNKGKVCFFGNGAAKCQEVISHPNASFYRDIVPLAEDMRELANQAFVSGDFVDVAYFVPFYLKDFVATVPKNKVF